jgi:excisionase family DNA binding protein
MGDVLTPQQAAHRAGVSRRTVARALADRSLPGIRDNLDRWRIDADAVDDWAARRSAPIGVASGHAMAGDAPAQPDAHAAELAGLRAERDGLRAQLETERSERERERAAAAERLAEVAADRDAWRALAGRSWWERWFGGRRGP